MTIGQRISDLRKERGYSQEYVAEKLDVSRQAVSKWECDASAPDTYNLIALSELFGVSVEYIAVGKKENTTETAPPPQAEKTVAVTNHYRQSLGLSNILGIIFLICGLVCGVLCIVMDEERLLPLAISFIFCAVMGFIQVKHKNLVVWWGYWLFFFLLSVFGMTSSPFLIFNPAYYVGGVSWHLIFGYIDWIWLAGNIVYTVFYVKRLKKQKESSGQELN
ncbi:MAG: helix-turn-helix transcriptional regulator [Clostridia bacterium]|nr:helix-turn-helix transcriptional regulator [Clostridia bacterium]